MDEAQPADRPDTATIDGLLAVVRDFMSAPTLSGRRRVLEDDPHVLSGAYLQLIADLLADTDLPAETGEFLGGFAGVLGDCRRRGVDAVFDPAEQQVQIRAAGADVRAALEAYLLSPSWSQLPESYARHPALASEEAVAAIADLEEQARFLELDGAVVTFDRHRRALARAQEVGPEQAAGEVALAEADDRRRSVELLDELASLPTDGPAGFRDWVERHPEVVGSPFLAFLDGILDGATDGEDEPEEFRELAEVTRVWRRVLRLGRERGAAVMVQRVDDAFATMGGLEPILRAMDDAVGAGRTDDGVEALVAAVGHCRRALAHPAFLLLGPEPWVALHEHACQLMEHLFHVLPDRDLLALRIRTAQAALAEARPGSAVRLALYDKLAFALSQRSELTGSTADTARSVELCRAALDSTDPAEPAHAFRSARLAAALRDLYLTSREPAVLDEAIAHFRLATAQDPEVLDRGNLAAALLDRYGITADPADLAAAIDGLQDIVATAPDTEPHLPRFLADLADALLDRAEAAGGPALADVEAAIGHGDRALALRPTGSVRLRCHTVLSRAHDLRYRYGRDPADQDRAIELLHAARQVALPGSRHAEQIGAQHASACLRRHLETRRPDHLDAALTAVRQELAELPGDSPVREQLHLTAAIAETLNARTTRAVADLDRAVELWETLPGDAADIPGTTLGLAEALLDRGRVTGSVTDLERSAASAIDLVGTEAGQRAAAAAVRATAELFIVRGDVTDLRRCLDIAEPTLPVRDDEDLDFADLVALLTGGWSRLVATIERRPDADAVVRTIEDRIPALGWTDPRSAFYAELLSEIHAEWYGVNAEVGWLRRAAYVLDIALRAHPVDSAEHLDLRARAGFRYRELYTATGDPSYGQAAFGHLEYVRAAAPADSSLAQFALHNLGVAHRARFNATGDLADLDEAIDAMSESLARVAPDDADQAVGFGNLANALRARHDLTGDAEDLDRAAELQQRAVDLLEPGHPDRPNRLHNLASVYLARYREADDPADLDRAIDAQRAAVDSEAGSSIDLAEKTGALGNLYRARFWATADPTDLDAAVRFGTEALAAAQRGTRGRSVVLVWLAQALSLRADLSGGAADADAANRHFREAAQPVGPNRSDVRRIAAFEWAKWAARRGAWDDAAQAYRAGLDIVDELLRAQVNPSYGATWQVNFGGFSADAAFALLQVDDAAAAAVAVETGRAVTLSRALELDHADLDRLAAEGRPELAARFRAAAARWVTTWQPAPLP